MRDPIMHLTRRPATPAKGAGSLARRKRQEPLLPPANTWHRAAVANVEKLSVALPPDMVAERRAAPDKVVCRA